MRLLCKILAGAVEDTMSVVEDEVLDDLLCNTLEEEKAETLAGKLINLEANTLLDKLAAR